MMCQADETGNPKQPTIATAPPAEVQKTKGARPVTITPLCKVNGKTDTVMLRRLQCLATTYSSNA
jgi:hypothetical protein